MTRTVYTVHIGGGVRYDTPFSKLAQYESERGRRVTAVTTG